MSEQVSKTSHREAESRAMAKGSRLLLEEMEGAAKAMHRVVKAEEQLAKAAAGAAKAAKGALAGFDQLDVLTQKTASGGKSQEKQGEPSPAERFPGMGKGQGGSDVERHSLTLEGIPELTDDFHGIGEAFQGLTDGMGEAWQTRLEGLLTAWSATGALLTGNVSLLLPALGEAVTAAWEESIQPVLDSLSQKLGTLWAEKIVPGFGALMQYISQLVAQAPQILKNFIQPVADAFALVLLPGTTEAMGTIQETARALGEAIGAVALGVKATLAGITEFLSGVFTGDWARAWEGVREIFSGQWKAMSGFAKGTVNAVISLINAMIRAAADGINYLIGQLNKIRFEVPDWVPGIGGKSWGIHIDALSPYQIPMLATGAVIPPGAEFLAVLGDQRAGRNLEAPEGLIRQIVREESGGQGVRLNVSAKGTAGELVRWLRFEMEREDSRRGESLVKGGDVYAVY